MGSSGEEASHPGSQRVATRQTEGERKADHRLLCRNGPQLQHGRKGSSAAATDGNEQRRKEAEVAATFLEKEMQQSLWLGIMLVPHHFLSKSYKKSIKKERRNLPKPRSRVTVETTVSKKKGKGGKAKGKRAKDLTTTTSNA